MLNRQSARSLARYRQWADQLTFEAVALLPPGEADKERPTPLKSIIGTLNHTYLVDLIWRAHLEGSEHGFKSRHLMLHEDLSELWEAQQAINRWYIDWSDWQSERMLDDIVRFHFIDGKRGAMSRGAILLHVVNHATYHRGWVSEMLFKIPASNPTTDLPVYLSNFSQPEEETPHDQPIPLRSRIGSRFIERHAGR
jgi:uncharacterized damage-inducible protein DinB